MQAQKQIQAEKLLTIVLLFLTEVFNECGFHSENTAVKQF